jgi:hypothetical protein
VHGNDTQGKLRIGNFTRRSVCFKGIIKPLAESAAGISFKRRG